MMNARPSLDHLAGRITTGAFILHSGLEKWNGGPEAAEGTHGMASTAYPALAKLRPPRFLKLLAATEIALGAALLTPLVPDRVAGAALTGFSGGLLGLYARVPGLRREGSVWPTQNGIGLAKDAWMVGIGLDLLAARPRDRRASGAPAAPGTAGIAAPS
jgi:uncharacterized membrane protein YphA (DoxX/SURF4 family)